MEEPQIPENMNTGPYEVSGPPPKRFWGAWSTTGFGLAIIIVSVIVQAIITIIFIIVEMVSMAGTDFDISDYSAFLETIDMGLLLSLSIIISAVVCLGLIYLIIKAKHGAPYNEYIGFKSISLKAGVISLLILFAFIALSALVNYALDLPTETDVMTDAYITSMWPALFWIASVVFAPLFEEVFFRGFLFEGFRRSRLGDAGAIFLTSLVWAGFHLQYQLFQIASIFVLGIILGVVRYRTGSIWAPLIMHASNNLLAVLFITIGFGV